MAASHRSFGSKVSTPLINPKAGELVVRHQIFGHLERLRRVTFAGDLFLFLPGC